MWQTVNLGDICTISSSKRIFAKEYQTEGIPFYRGKEVIEKHNGNSVSTELFISPERYEEIKRKFPVPKVGDILLTSVGTLGVPWLVDEDGFYFKDGNLTWLRCNAEILSGYLYLWLNSAEAQNQIDAKCIGSTQKALTIETLNKFQITLPSLEVQEKIVSAVKPLESRININRKINKNLLEQALAVYKAWFCEYALSDGIRPESWPNTTIEELSSLVSRGIAPKYDDNSDQIVLNQKCIRDHTIDLSFARRHLPKKINEKWITKGDLLINSTGTGTLGRVAQVWFDANNMTVDSHVTIVRPKDPILQGYLGFWGLSHESEIEAQHTGSTGQTELPRDRVKSMELPQPDADTLRKFNEFIIPLTSTIVSNQEENARLSQIRDTLLPKLMSGEIDVSELDL